MLELSELDTVNRDYHWVFRLVDHPSHPLKDILLDYAPHGGGFFQTAYMYLGELPRAKKNKKICIIHFHSDLNEPMKFMQLQNLDSYRCMFDLQSEDIVTLATQVSRETVIDLSKSDALTKWHLDEINNCDYFYIADETGFVKSYATLFYGG